MVFGLPAIGEGTWGQKILDSINAVKATADAAQPSATLDASVTAVDANAASALRVQQDARLAATYVPLTRTATDAQQGIVELATTAETATGTDATRAVTPAGAAATYAGLAAAVNNFTGKIEIDGGFTNALDSDLWVAGPIRNGPTNDSQGIYVQHRVMGDLGAQVHDGIGAEVRVTSGTNASAVCGLETTAQVGGAGTNLSDVRSITSNFVIQGDAAGSITSASVLRAQTIPALPGGFTIGTTYGLYVEGQSVGTTNWSIYAPSGYSHIFALNVGDPLAIPSGVDLHVYQSGATTAALRVEGNRARLQLDGAGGTDTSTVSFRLAGTEKFKIEHNSTTDELHLLRTGASAAQVRIGNGYVGFRDGDRLSFGTTTGVRIGYDATEKLAFYGTTPIVQPTGTPAAATDAATTQTLVNDLRTKLLALGLIA